MQGCKGVQEMFGERVGLIKNTPGEG